jgi:transposase-like protein
LKGVDYVYLLADEIHFSVRLEEARLFALVIVGRGRANGAKELVSISDGYRESIESWANVLRGLKRRGMTAPVLAVGDGASGSGEHSARSSPTPPLAVLGAQVEGRLERLVEVCPP